MRTKDKEEKMSENTEIQKIPVSYPFFLFFDGFLDVKNFCCPALATRSRPRLELDLCGLDEHLRVFVRNFLLKKKFVLKFDYLRN